MVILVLAMMLVDLNSQQLINLQIGSLKMESLDGLTLDMLALLERSQCIRNLLLPSLGMPYLMAMLHDHVFGQNILWVLSKGDSSACVVFGCQ